MKFLLIGGGTFFVDAGILQVLVAGFDMSPFFARAFSFLSAVTVTWWLNRKYTFKTTEAPNLKEFGRYIMTQGVGLAVNVGIYSLCVVLFDVMRTYPALALIPATSASLICNFISMKFLVFRRG